MSEFKEIYRGDRVVADLVDKTVEVTIGLDTYSLSEAKEIFDELGIVLKRVAFREKIELLS